MELYQEYKDKIIALIQALIPEAKIYLFGSYARGTSRPGSDIDIALDAGTKIERIRISELADVLASCNIPHKIDLVDVQAIKSDFKAMIDKDKVLWKS